MPTVLLDPPNSKNQDLGLVYQMENQCQASKVLGVWHAVSRQQVWHRLEILSNGLVLLKLKSGQTISGMIEFVKDKCTVTLFMNTISEPIRITGAWCLWRDTLDFTFLGEYLLFSQD
jgi:hypothetical protein